MTLKTGTRCVIVAGCPENIGLIVEVVGRVLPSRPDEEAYCIETVSRRPFHQLWEGNDLLRGDSTRAITERYKLRPLVFSKDEVPNACAEEMQPKLSSHSEAV